MSCSVACWRTGARLSCGTETSAAWSPEIPKATTGSSPTRCSPRSGEPPRASTVFRASWGRLAAQAYSEELRARAPAGEQPGGLPALDIALLGLGEDGHTASLFPGHPEVQDESGALCLPVRDAPKPPPERVTLSLPLLRSARHCLLLATGSGKAAAVAGVLAGPDPQVPASLLASGRLHVLIDDAATPAPRARRPPAES